MIAKEGLKMQLWGHWINFKNIIKSDYRILHRS